MLWDRRLAAVITPIAAAIAIGVTFFVFSAYFT